MEATNQRQQSSKFSKQVDQNRGDNLLEQRNEDIQNVLKVKCKNHPKRNAELLHLIPNVENPRICNMCVCENDIPRKNYQEIREIIQESRENDLLFYPILTDSGPGEILQNIDECIDSETFLMDKYFQDLANLIKVIVERRRQDRKLKVKQYGDIYKRSKACWSEITDIETLRLLLLDENNEERLAQFVRNHIANAERNTQQIKQLCDQLQDIKDKFSVEQPKKIRSLIWALLEEIDFFKGLHSIEQSDEYRNALQRKQTELDDCMSQSNQAQRTIYEQQQQLKKMRILMGKHEQEITSLRQETSGLKKEISDLKQESSAILQQLNREKKINTSLREQLDCEKKSTQSLNQQLIDIKAIKLRDNKSCGICFSQIESGEELAKMPCPHTFHQECISEWKKYKSECPLCKKVI